MLQEVSSDDVNRYDANGSNGDASGSSHHPLTPTQLDGRPPLPKKQQSGSSFSPLEEWHAQKPAVGQVGLSHAGRDRRRREILEGSPPLHMVTEEKGGSIAQQRHAIKATIWSFVATAVFAFGFVLPTRGRKDTLDFITGFLVEKSLSVDNLFVFLMIFEYFKGESISSSSSTQPPLRVSSSHAQQQQQQQHSHRCKSATVTPTSASWRRTHTHHTHTPALRASGRRIAAALPHRSPRT